MMDSLLRTTGLGHRVTLFPLGFAMDLRSNDPRILEAASISWGQCEQRFAESPLDIRVIVGDGNETERPPQPAFRAQGHLTAIVSDRFNFAACDYSKGLGVAWVQQSVAADPAFFRWFFLEAMVYCLLTEMYLTPVHAGCIALGGQGVLLAGGSGAGKSTLAFGCARLGWNFVSDDAVWMPRKRDGLSVVGLPHRARLRPDCVQFFPELAGYVSSIGANGKPTLDVPLRDLPSIRSQPECEVAASVFLKRGACKRPSLERLDAEDAFDRLAEEMVIYDEGPRSEQLRSLKRLAQAPAYTLHYENIESAAAALRRLLESGEGRVQ
jgi:hypothetical protein